ncbi:hypothetical protein Celaphus_00013531 [Cervus elaphus hippelaphus]|uniref:Uncharacterized protein n=1 Tax=Cervus elaphus hippelaphus TaxID=46360 RepID=A0A212DG62_CEREH|nr:hypothetical protein Celaphus_00013531 [Cervus elaphus hippelaphus]
MGLRETTAGDKKDVVKVSMECGVISSHTAFIAVNKDLNRPIQGPLSPRDVPRPLLLCAAPVVQSFPQQKCGQWRQRRHRREKKCTSLSEGCPEKTKPCGSAKKTSVETRGPVLAVLWLHDNAKDMECEWELLERKAVAWIRIHAGSVRHELVKAAIALTKSSVDPAIFGP